MNTKESIKKEVLALYNEGSDLALAFQKDEKNVNFPYAYQNWYTKALRVVHFLASDRYNEFKSYYEIDPKRKNLNYETYVIQDFLKNITLDSYIFPGFKPKSQTLIRFFNQLTIFSSLTERVDYKLANLDSELLSEIQEAELIIARKLIKISIRAAGSLAGVVIEHHLQKVVNNHGILISKKNPTINDLNEPLKNESIIDTVTWRKITYLADIRNICSHKKDVEPSKEQVLELIDGADWLTKNIF